MKTKIIIFLGFLFICGCSAIDYLSFCYDDNGKKYCGTIGISGKTQEEKSIVIEETIGEETRELYTFTGEEVKILADTMAVKQGIGASSVETLSKEYNSDYTKLKEFVTRRELESN